MKFLRNHPLVLSILIIIYWFILSGVFVSLLSLITGLSIIDMNVYNAGRLFCIVLLLIFVWRFDWIDLQLIKNPGNWKIWLAAVVVVFYLIFAGNYAYFGSFQIDWQILFSSESAHEIMRTQVFVGLV